MGFLGTGRKLVISYDAIALKHLRSSTVVNSYLEVVSQELALILEGYLEEDLENLVAQVIPILAINQVINNRVMATTPEDLELSI